MKQKSVMKSSANLVGCSLKNPVNEWEEHPTYCEVLDDIEQKYLLGR